MIKELDKIKSLNENEKKYIYNYISSLEQQQLNDLIRVINYLKGRGNDNE